MTYGVSVHNLIGEEIITAETEFLHDAWAIANSFNGYLDLTVDIISLETGEVYYTWEKGNLTYIAERE